MSGRAAIVQRRCGSRYIVTRAGAGGCDWNNGGGAFAAGALALEPAAAPFWADTALFTFLSTRSVSSMKSQITE